MRVATGYWAPTESSQPEPCPEAGFYCPGYEHDDTNEPPGSKPILIDAGLYRAASSVSSTVSRLHFALTTLATQLTLEEVQSRLADLYQVATTSVEVHDDDGTTTDDEGTTDDDGRRQLKSGQRVLRRPPLPERSTKHATAATVAAAAATRSGLKYLGAASPRRMLLEGGRALGIDLKAASERPSDQALLLAAYAAVGEADLSAALGGATVVSEAASLVSSAAVDVVMGSVACPRGHWCSAGNAIPCGANTYEEGDQVRNGAAAAAQHAAVPSRASAAARRRTPYSVARACKQRPLRPYRTAHSPTAQSPWLHRFPVLCRSTSRRATSAPPTPSRPPSRAASTPACARRATTWRAPPSPPTTRASSAPPAPPAPPPTSPRRRCH